METFKIKSGGFDEIKKQLIIKSVSLLLISISFGIGIVFFNSENKEDVLDILPFMFPIIICALTFGIFNGLKRQKMLFESYQLIFSENNVIRKQVNTPIVNIQFDDIKSIVKNKSGGYTIKGKTAIETILIPAQIENHENLEILFSKIKSIEEFQKLAFDEKYKIPLIVIILGSMATVYVSTNKILVGICAVLCSILLIRSFIEIRKNKNIDLKTKRISYYLLFVLLSVIGVTVMKLTSDFCI